MEVVKFLIDGYVALEVEAANNHAANLAQLHEELKQAKKAPKSIAGHIRDVLQNQAKNC